LEFKFINNGAEERIQWIKLIKIKSSHMFKMLVTVQAGACQLPGHKLQLRATDQCPHRS